MMARNAYKIACQEVANFKRQKIAAYTVYSSMLPNKKKGTWRFVKALIIGHIILDRIEDGKCDVPLKRRRPGEGGQSITAKGKGGSYGDESDL